MGEGLLALIGVSRHDTSASAGEMARRILHLRIFADAEQRMNRSLLGTGGALGLVSQFTLFGDARRGRRPFFGEAMPAGQAAPLIESVAEAARALGVVAVSGRFGASMDVELVNAGPVTLLLDTDRRF